VKQWLVCLVLVFVAVGCQENGNPSDPSQVTIEFSTTDLVVGTGTQAAAGNTVTVNYTGWLYSNSGVESKGQQFDSSLNPGRTPFQFRVGANQVIRGFDQTVLGMRVGGKRRTYIPSNLGYGAQGSADGTIPPNAALVFEIELLTVVP
jgi:FKBP-type peptidyl-prolyl cis-trans isomerase FkpA